MASAEVEPTVPQGRGLRRFLSLLGPRCILGGCEATAAVQVSRARPPQGELSSGERQGPASGGDPEPRPQAEWKVQEVGRVEI